MQKLGQKINVNVNITGGKLMNFDFEGHSTKYTYSFHIPDL